MKNTFMFYDLETSGISPKNQRIMQFAGQRTDMNLQPVGDPHNYLLALPEDILPDPWAILVTGITPQKTQQEGITEAEFLQIFHSDIATPGTIFAGFNTIRFDDEFMRYLNYRNFYDAYEWHWQDGRGRWDLLDVSRMTRALRPEGITWPFAPDGKPSNKLEYLTNVNNLSHENAHDALSDVQATISLARLIQSKQPKLFEYLLHIRDKRSVEKLVVSNQPFVYSSGKYSSEREKTAVALYIGDNPKSGAFVYDLYHDPTTWLTKTPAELADAWQWKKDQNAPRLPVKSLQYNRCPAVAPYGVLDTASKQRLQITDEQIIKHQKILQRNQDNFYTKILSAAEILNKKQQTRLLTESQPTEERLYDGFFNDSDKKIINKIHKLSTSELATFKPRFQDERLAPLFMLYRARNFPKTLTTEEENKWQEFKSKKLFDGGETSRLATFIRNLQTIATRDTKQDNQFILEELKLYAESLSPHQES